ncbi:hypothetical protein BN961_00084 [Afipia felis]|uniref:Uncharacterized protein n=1 Tax=Afipia felis TaxID=1035 RepID=A0A090MM04_AFIFE|nr:hypothetical protein BN961_00084 [Afipia felis]
MVVDLSRVEARDGQSRKEGREKRGARLGQLVEHERAAGDLGQDGEESGAGRGLQHAVGRRNRGGCHRCNAQRNRRREPLEGLRFLRAARVRRHQAGDLDELRQDRRRVAGFTEKRLSVFAQKEDGRGFAGVIGRLPVPCAGGVGSAEGSFHRAAQRGGVDALTAFEMWKEELRCGEDRTCAVGIADERKLCGSGQCHRCGSHGHDANLGRAGRE